MKKTFLTMLVAAMALGAQAVEWTTEDVDGGVRLTGAEEQEAGDVEVPETIDGKPVVEIGECAFLEWEGTSSFTLPNSLVKIGYAAFGFCSGINEQTIPASVTFIDDNAFAGCGALTDIYFEGDCPGGTDDVGLWGSTYIHVSEDAKGWGETWCLCPVSRDFTPPVPPSPTPVLTIVNGVVTKCDTSATGAIEIPAVYDGVTVTNIGENAFAGCDKLTEIEFLGDRPTVEGGSLGLNPSTCVVLCDDSRAGWRDADGNLPKTFCGLNLKARCYPFEEGWLTRENADGTITIVGLHHYRDEKELAVPTSIGGKTVSALGEGAFDACEQLEVLSFACDALTAEGDLGLDGLQTVISVPAGTRGWDEGGGFWQGCLIIWGDYLESFWLAEEVSGGVKITGTVERVTGRVDVPSTLGGQPVLQIEAGAFADCKDLLSISIPASVQAMGDNVFSGCTALGDVVFSGSAPTGTGSLGLPEDATVWVREDSFGWGLVPGEWRGVRTAYWPAELLFTWEATEGGVTITGLAAEDLRVVTVPATLDGKKVVSIGEDAFASAPNLGRLTFEGERPTVLGESAGLDAAKCVVYARYPATGWPGAEYAPQPSTWQGCRLEFFTHPETFWTTTTLDDGTLTITGTTGFSGELDGTAILPGEIGGKKVTAVAPYCFDSCEGLTGILLHPNITTLGEGAFCKTPIGSLILTSNLTDVAANALVGCTNLTAVYVWSDTPPAWLAGMGADPANCTVYVAYDASGWGELPTTVGGYAVEPGSHLEGFWVTEGSGDGTLSVAGTAENVVGPAIVPATIGGKKVARIGLSAFARQRELGVVMVPASVTALGADAFAGCTALSNVTFRGAAPSAPESVGLSSENCTVYAPYGAEGWDYGISKFQGVPIVWYPAPVYDETGKQLEAFWKTRENEDGSLTLLGFNGTCEGDLVMPRKIGGKPLVGIAAGAFEGCALTTLTLGGNPPALDEDNDLTGTKIIVPKYALAKYLADPVWGKYAAQIEPDGDSVEPVVPGEELAVPQGQSVEQFVNDINTNDAVKAQYIKAPGDVEATSTYRSYFAAVPVGDATVTFALNALGTNEVVKAQDEAKTNLLATVVAAKTTGEKAATLTIENPMIGFYYCLIQAEELTGEALALQKLAGKGGATTVEFDLTKWPASGFYQLLVSPTSFVNSDQDNAVVPKRHFSKAQEVVLNDDD